MFPTFFGVLGFESGQMPLERLQGAPCGALDWLQFGGGRGTCLFLTWLRGIFRNRHLEQ